MACIVLITVFLGFFLILSRNVKGEPAGTMKIIESATGAKATILGDESVPMPLGGYPFAVNITIEGHFESLYTFQVAVRFDKTKLNFSSAMIPTKDPNFVFFDKFIATSGAPLVNSFSHYGVVTLGATLILESINVSKGLLCAMSFVAQRVGDSMIDFNLVDPETFLLKLAEQDGEPINRDIPFTPESFSVSTFAAPSLPVPLFEFTPTFPDVNANVTFDSATSYDPVGNITSYAWDFDDGTTPTTTNITSMLHVFGASRIYSVNLTVYSNFGNSSSIVQEVQVGRVPSVNFTYSPNEATPGETVAFDASLSSDADGTIAYCVWNFGDNSSLANLTETIAAHTYSQKGVYWVRLTVYDNNGLYNSTSQEVFIGRRPTVLATFAPEKPLAFDAVVFNASMTHAGEASDEIVMLHWEFGDSNITDINIAESSLLDPFVITHIYYSGQPYSGNVTAFDQNGLYSTYGFLVDVQTPSKTTPLDYALYAAIAAAAIVTIALVAVVVKRRKK
jgi:PKD repeat protein